MKHKLRTILLIFVLMLGFGVNAETKIKEDASSYAGDVYIIGSSKFDSSIIVNGTMASVAGARETYVQYMVHQNFKFKPEDLRIYYYSELAESWSVLPATSDEEFKVLTPEEAKELTENLYIYYVNEEEKILEVPYDVTLEEGYELKFVTNDESNDEKVKYDNGKLIIPATVKWVDTYVTKDEEEVYLGTVEQIDSSFENTLSVVNTYDTLKKAIEDGIENIQLGANIDLPTALEINKKVNLNLDLYNLTVTNDTAGDGVFHVVEGGDLTIDGVGKVDGVGNNKWNIAIFAEAGKVTINGGTYTNVNAKIMEGDTDSNHYDVIYAKGTAQVEINGGYFEGKTPEWLLNIHDGSRETASITVKGGTFVGFNPADNKAEGEGTSFLAEGYKVMPYNGEYTVSEISSEDVAIINNVAYIALGDAIVHAEEGSTVKLLKDIDLPTALEVNKKVVIDLNSHNLTVSTDTAGDGVFHVVEGGDLTINGDGKVDGVGNNKWNIAIFAEAGKVTINGGTYTNVNAKIMEGDTDSNHYDVIYAKGTAQVEINGGYFEGKTPEWLLNIHDGSRETASITVKGGTFVGFNPADNKAEGEGTSFLADGYKVVETDGEYEVVLLTDEDYVLVDGIAYADLNTAVTNAKASSTVKLLKDIDLPTALAINKKVVIDLNSHNLTVSTDTAGDGVFHVVEGGDLTINGDGKVDGVGNNKWNIAIFAEAGKVTLNGGTYTNVNAKIMEGDTDSNHYDVIYAKGTAQVEINGGYFEGKTPEWLLNIHDGSRETASITVKGGTFDGFNPANNKAEGEGTNFVADGYKVVENNGEYTVTEE